jgi:hypothetical protein
VSLSRLASPWADPGFVDILLVLQIALIKRSLEKEGWRGWLSRRQCQGKFCLANQPVSSSPSCIMVACSMSPAEHVSGALLSDTEDIRYLGKSPQTLAEDGPSDERYGLIEGTFRVLLREWARLFCKR